MLASRKILIALLIDIQKAIFHQSSIYNQHWRTVIHQSFTHPHYNVNILRPLQHTVYSMYTEDKVYMQTQKPNRPHPILTRFIPPHHHHLHFTPCSDPQQHSSALRWIVQVAAMLRTRSGKSHRCPEGPIRTSRAGRVAAIHQSH